MKRTYTFILLRQGKMLPHILAPLDCDTSSAARVTTVSVALGINAQLVIGC